MGNLLNSLVTVAESMRTTQLAIETAGNNVVNAKTPNFVKQRLDLQAKRFELSQGLVGGVESGGLISGRKEFLERSVQEQNHRYGRFAQQASSLEGLEPIFDVSGGSGVGGAVDRLFESFSAWSVAPNDMTSRQAVLERADELAKDFRLTAASLATAKADGEGELNSTVARINQLGENIRKYNVEVRTHRRNLDDPGLDASVYKQLEDLSELMDFDAIRSPDGSFNVNLGGQTPLTIGGSVYPISADLSSGAVTIRNAQGGDISGQIRQGRLGAQIDQQNGVLPGLTGGLNRLAAAIADTVNTTLAAGVDRNGNAPVTNLFAYDASAGAASLRVNNLDPAELAAASAGAPGGNGNALNLADLSRQQLLDNNTPAQFFGSLAARVGRDLGNARADESTQASLVTQARNVRASQTEVSVDEEAANLVAFQRQFQANAELVRILNSLTETTINIIR